jgi:hypothetical protein
METLKGLPLVEDVTKPVPDTVTTYYKDTFAKGTGEFGTFTMQDFLGSSTGTVTTTSMQNMVATLRNMNISALTSLYNQMLLTVQGVYDDPLYPPQIIIPSGPAAGTYADGNAAFTSGLIPSANTLISSLISTYPSATTSLNNSANAICEQYVYEYTNQTKAGLVFADLASGSQQSTISFISGLASAGLGVEIGGQSSYLSSVANAATESGQAILGSLREGRNNTLMDKT